MKNICLVLVCISFGFIASAQWGVLASNLRLNQTNSKGLPTGKFRVNDTLLATFTVNYFGGTLHQRESKLMNYPQNDNNPLMIRLTLEGASFLNKKDVVSGKMASYFKWSLTKGGSELIGFQSLEIPAKALGIAYDISAAFTLNKKDTFFKVSTAINTLNEEKLDNEKSKYIPRNAKAIESTNQKGEKFISVIHTGEQYLMASIVKEKNITMDDSRSIASSSPGTTLPTMTNVFPTLFDTKLTIAIDADRNQEARLSIFDLNGEKVYDTKINAVKGLSSQTIYPGSMVSGNYFLKITGISIHDIHKIIKS